MEKIITVMAWLIMVEDSWTVQLAMSVIKDLVLQLSMQLLQFKFGLEVHPVGHSVTRQGL